MPNSWLYRRMKQMRVMINMLFLASLITLMNGQDSMLGLKVLLVKDMLEGILVSANLAEFAFKIPSEEQAELTNSLRTRIKTLINRLETR